MRILLALLALLMAVPASAEHCTTWSTHEADLDTCLIADTAEMTPACIYVAEENCDPECGPFSLWVYEESNGYPGLQRGDEVEDDTCHGMIVSDTIVF